MNMEARRPWGVLWCLTVILAASSIWISGRPFMIDVPQHAAQIALLGDLLSGKSRWSEMMTINPWTPYLVGYGASWVLSLWMPVLTAIKLLLMISFLGFMLASRALRKELNGAPEMDWLSLPVFFGFSYVWGFMTFLVAAPICMMFLLMSNRWCQRPGWNSGLKVFVFGLFLLVSHGLMFVFGACAAAVLLGCSKISGGLRSRLLRVLPVILLGVFFLAYAWHAKRLEATYPVGDINSIKWNASPVMRLMEFFSFPLDNQFSGDSALLVMALLAAPWCLGLEFGRGWRRPAVLWGLLLLTIFFLVPDFALGTAFLYQRFSLFVLPFYGWLFVSASSSIGHFRYHVGMCLLALCAWLPLIDAANRSLAFDAETRVVDEWVHMLRPGERALYLPLDSGSRLTSHALMHLHTGSYYQAEMGGLVDFNFAWFPPQVVRFKPESLPVEVGMRFSFSPEKFDWAAHRGSRYRYFIFRSYDGWQPKKIMRQSPCSVKKIYDKAEWQVFEQIGCSTQ
jgi:hypothetical protein